MGGSAGVQSFRLGASDFQFHWNNDKGEPIHYSKFRDFDQLMKEKDTLLYSDMPNKLDIGLGNYCDLKCIYCNHVYSSQWEVEDRKHGLIFTDPDKPVDLVVVGDMPNILDKAPENWFSNFLNWFDTVAHHLERIALLGGEPTHSPLFDPLVDHITKRLSVEAHPNATISIVSNLNWKPKVLDRILQFRKELPENVKIRIEISMESVGDKAEFIRNGVKWERFKTNFESIAAHHNIDVVPVTTINGLCLTSLCDYLKFIKSIEDSTGRKFHVIANRLVFPKWLSINVLDSSFAPYVRETINWIKENYNDSSKDDLIGRLTDIETELNASHDVELLGYFTKWIKAMDRRRGTEFVKVFPEFANLIALGEKNYKVEYTKDDIFKWSR